MRETLAELAYRHALLPGGNCIPRVSVHGAQETSWPVPTLYRPMLGMSEATLHRHFRAATAMSPLQYQKALLLQEARRRLIADADVAGQPMS